MQFALGVLTTTCIALTVALVIVWTKLNNRFVALSNGFTPLVERIDNLAGTIAHMPAAVQNIIHLGLKNSQVTTGLVVASLSIRPEDFQIQVDKLKRNLLVAFEKEKHPDIGTRAYCILDKAGIDEFVDNSSCRELQKALTRLLTNDDADATKRFLDTVAESICQAAFTAVPAE